MKKLLITLAMLFSQTATAALHSSLPVPLPLSMGGLGAAHSAPGVETVVSFPTGSSAAVLLEIATNLTSNGSELGTTLFPTFTSVNTTDVTTTNINSIAAPSQGTYTPTFTNVANVASFGTVSDASWVRVGNRVIVWGRVSIDPTSASVNTQFRMSLPVATNMGLFTDLGGACVCKESVSLSVAVLADTTNDQANFQYINTTETGARDFSYIFGYDVI